MEGNVTKVTDGYQLRFERHLRHPVEKVWAAITESNLSAQWLAPAQIEQRQGGRVVIRFANSETVIDGTVLAIDPPHLLEYGWKDQNAYRGPVRWELSPEVGGTKLVLTHTLPYALPDKPYDYLAGWDTHLEQMAHLLDGHPIAWSRDRWQQIRADYVAAHPNL